MDRRANLQILKNRSQPVTRVSLELEDTKLVASLEEKFAEFRTVLEQGVTIKNLADFEQALDKLKQDIDELKSALPVPQIMKSKTIGDITYIATAPVGSDPKDKVWRVMRIDETNNAEVRFASKANYVNQAIGMDKLKY